MKVSLILPYWERQEAALRALELLGKNYSGLDLEAVIVDDGSPTPFLKPTGWGLRVQVVTLPQKKGPKNPCMPINRGVEAASGDVIVLSNPEILHTVPVLEQMLEELKRQGPRGYVLAAAWCPEEDQWHCHSTIRPLGCPPGTGLHFCAMLYKEFFNEVGGFDEEYRDGACFDDNDWVQRLVAAGAKFKIRDDLIVTHPKEGARISWPPMMHARNKALFEKKWQMKPVTVCTVSWGNYQGCGARYVNNLFDMVRRNLPEGYPGRFVCFTDDTVGLDEGIEVRSLPEGVKGWYNKLYLFKEGVFKAGERVIFMDLDTLIVGPLDDLVSYAGDFATLHDFYYPDRLGPAVICWKGGTHKKIWDEYQRSPMEHPRGDAIWLEHVLGNSDGYDLEILQNLYPGAFASYKFHCHPYPPKEARIVCFHGNPRPHVCTEPWVEAVWKVGGGMASELVAMANTQTEEVTANIRSACARALPWAQSHDAHEGRAVLVAGGPSLLQSLPELRFHVEQGDTIIALNGSSAFLAENGITADWQIVIDAREHNLRFVQPALAKQYMLASQCHPSLFDALEGKPVTVLHLGTAELSAGLPDSEQIVNLITGGSTVGLIAISVAYLHGFRHFHLYGYDSSFGVDHHAYDQLQNDADRVIECSVGGRQFKSTFWMIKQVEQFQQLSLALANVGCVIVVHGDGMLPHVAQLMAEQIMKAEQREAA